MDNFPFALFLIFTGAAILATVALYVRQTIIIAYILAGILAGPSITGWIDQPQALVQAGSIGITFLLFLLGMNLTPAKLVKLLGAMLTITGISVLVLGLLGFGFGIIAGFTFIESLILGAATMFSSTIIGLKLLPTTVLHHKRTGEIIVSVLLLQDAIAIIVLFAIQVGGQLPSPGWVSDTGAGLALVLVSLPLTVAIAYILQNFIINRLLKKFDKIREYLFLIVIGWCVGISELATVLGLSHEIGAFIAGVAIATHPIALYIAESLKPVRDFFLIIFFFSLGGGLDIFAAYEVLPEALVLSGMLLIVKPQLFYRLIRRLGHDRNRSMEIGVRLGQGSEFSLLVGTLALQAGLIGSQMSHLIQLTVILSFIVSSYWIVARYPTPIALSDELRRD